MAIFNSFTFDGENSLGSGIYITGQAVYNAPERTVEMISVPGRNGALAIDQGHFENIQVTYPAGCFADNLSDFANKISAFRNILASRYTYKRLIDTYNPDEFRLGLYKSGLEAETVNYNTAGEFNIEFECKPQRWLKSGETESAITSGVDIANNYMPCYPIFKITGNGTFVVNGNSVAVANNLNKTLVLDCETQNAYTGTQNRNGDIYITGEFPYLKSGTNAVTFNNASVTMIPRWWTL